MDNPDDSRLISEVLTDCKLPLQIETIYSFTEARESLKEAMVTPDAVIAESNVLMIKGIHVTLFLQTE